jgi:ribonucleoside-diphosphate reductase alpha chain
VLRRNISAGGHSRSPEAVEETMSHPFSGATATEDGLDALPDGTKKTRGEVSAKECFIASPAPGPIGAGRAAISMRKATHAPSTTKCATCWPAQKAAPNSPQWFNTGLHWAYGIDGPSQGHFYVDFKSGELIRSASAYEHPQPHACFIQGVSDDLVNEGGIMDLWTREARLFKYGSGTGSNFSNLRGENEPLSGGGKSSGLMSFLKIGDRAAGAIKSGGTTRRAAKMVIVDADHPDIEDFIDWKVIEEQKVAASSPARSCTRSTSTRSSRPAAIARARAMIASIPRRIPALKREIKPRASAASRTITSSASSPSPSKGTTASNSASTTRIGIPKPI